jgi:drug/metabolite transporter (DMT)-like permease
MLISSLLFAFTGVFAKELSFSMDSIEIVFFRNIFGVFLISISIMKFPLKNSGKKLWLLIFRGTIGFIALLAFFYNIAHITLAEAMTFSKTSPIFTAIFAYIFLKERIYSRGVFGILVGFIGILFITGFDIVGLDKTDWLGIFSGIGAGLAYTSVRELRLYYDARSIVLSFMIIGTIAPIVLMVISQFLYIQSLDFMMGLFVLPTDTDYIYIIGLGVTATFAQLFMTKAYANNKAGLVSVISYFNIPFSILFGFIFFDDNPNIYVYLGIVLIVISGILITKEK